MFKKKKRKSEHDISLFSSQCWSQSLITLTHLLPGILLRKLIITKEKPIDENTEESWLNPFQKPCESPTSRQASHRHAELPASCKASPKTAQKQLIPEGSI